MRMLSYLRRTEKGGLFQALGDGLNGECARPGSVLYEIGIDIIKQRPRNKQLLRHFKWKPINHRDVSVEKLKMPCSQNLATRMRFSFMSRSILNPLIMVSSSVLRKGCPSTMIIDSFDMLAISAAFVKAYEVEKYIIPITLIMLMLWRRLESAVRWRGQLESDLLCR